MNKKLFFAIVLLINTLDAFDSSYWWITKTYSIKKDDPITMLFSKDDNVKKKFYCLWTLFINNELICKLWYDDTYRTFSLSKRYNRDYYKIKLYNKDIGEREDSYMLFRFIDYDKQNNLAKLEFFIHNELEDIKIVHDNEKR